MTDKKRTVVPDCTCDGLNILKDLTEHYTEKATQFIERKEPLKIWRLKTKKIADRLYNQLTLPEQESPESNLNVSNFIKRSSRVQSDKKLCEDGLDEHCTYYLDDLVARLHHNPETIRKLLCSEQVDYKIIRRLQSDVYQIMTDLLTSEHIDPKSPNALYNPYEVYITNEIQEECNKRLKK